MGANYSPPEADRAVKRALFSNLQLAIIDIGPGDFSACWRSASSSGQNVLVLGSSNPNRMLLNVKARLEMLVIDPRRYFQPRAVRTVSANGKPPDISEVTGSRGASSQLRDCTPGESLSIKYRVDALMELVGLLNTYELNAIFLIPPHTPQYRDEMAKHKIGRIALAALGKELKKMEAHFENFCVIDLYSLELDAGNFFDGSHLNNIGEIHTAPILESRVGDCLSEMLR